MKIDKYTWQAAKLILKWALGIAAISFIIFLILQYTTVMVGLVVWIASYLTWLIWATAKYYRESDND